VADAVRDIAQTLIPLSQAQRSRVLWSLMGMLAVR
jgi:hypothetical protein